LREYRQLGQRETAPRAERPARFVTRFPLPRAGAFAMLQWMAALARWRAIILAGLLGAVVGTAWLRGAAQEVVCTGDCNADNEVTVEELLTMVGIALGNADVSLCPRGDADGDGRITVDEILLAVGRALEGCPPAPTPRGELVVEASEPVGVIRELPNGLIVGGTPHMPAQYRVPAPEEVRVETFVSNLVVPWAMDFAPDGRLFVSERPGRIRVVRDGVLEASAWATLSVRAIGEGGLMGLALHPQFEQQPWVYVCYTFDDGGRAQNRISRLREENGSAAQEQILLDRFPGGTLHNGCRLKFGPDGKLYATTGDTFNRSLAQELSSLAGKVLRLNPDGSAPGDNPFGPASLIYSYGHRNSQGIAFHPRSGELFATEHGPSGEVGLGDYDEVNVIVAGGNYGWPFVVGAPGLDEFVDPLLTYPEDAVPPAGLTFYGAELIPQWTGNLFFTSLGAKHLQRVVLGRDDEVLAIERLFDFGRLRDVIEGPDGALYVSTSNRDGRGTPAFDDDRILRIVPAR
jgi:glucose/arabinose dehydrogenase